MMRAILMALAVLPFPALAGQVTVFAASSLKTALDQVAADWSAATGHKVVPVYAGSNQLAQQILQGAPADLFLSASSDWMDAVEAGGAVLPGTRADLLGNRLVLVAPAGGAGMVDLTAEGLAVALGDGRLAMALVDAVPAGQYGKAALTSLGLWDGVAARVAQADNARAALALVALEEAPLGIVYASDAVAEPGVRVVATFPRTSHDPILYPVALLQGSGPEDAAFLAALAGPAAREVFRRNGFVVPDAP